ncbi:ImuA family protein [Rhizobium sp.]
MSIPLDPVALRLVRVTEKAPPDVSFEGLRGSLAPEPLIEIMPAAHGDHVSALGFALAWALMASEGGLIFWAAPEEDFFEDGLPNTEGLAQFGMPLDRLLLVRAQSQKDALWATEQALSTPGIVALCAITPSKKPISLTDTRRLLLMAEHYRTRCLLLRLDAAGSSAARARWRISAAPSQAEEEELGPPAFAVELARNRTGPHGLKFNLRWSIHDHAFHLLEDRITMDGNLAAEAPLRPADPIRQGHAG